MMAGFCGNCGSSRPDGAKFCMQCGKEFAPAITLCPTCGQVWPIDVSADLTPGSQAGEPSAVSTPSAQEYVASTAPAPSVVPNPETIAATFLRGTYASVRGFAYFDGQEWYRAASVNGKWSPIRAERLDGLGADPDALSLVQTDVTAETVASGLPRGPELGPDYLADRDCGNCGFERPAEGTPCANCGSSNSGPVFRPGG